MLKTIIRWVKEVLILGLELTIPSLNTASKTGYIIVYYAMMYVDDSMHHIIIIIHLYNYTKYT